MTSVRGKPTPRRKNKMKNAEVIKIGLSLSVEKPYETLVNEGATSHGYESEYRMFLNKMYEDPSYSIVDFFRYAEMAADNESWLYDGNEEMFKGTRLEEDMK